MKLIDSVIEFFTSLTSGSGQKRLELIERYQRMAYSCNIANEHLKSLTNGVCYINYLTKGKWENQYLALFEETTKNKNYKKAKLSNEEQGKILEFRDNFLSFIVICNDYNVDFVKKEKENFKELFDNVEGRALDDQQRDCVCKDEINNLVVAGAGSGKTTTIVGKVKYLLNRYKYKPSELLVLSFTNASASEMRERIFKETGQDIDVMTFHKLGKEVIAQVEQKQPDLTDINLSEYIKEEFNSLTKNSQYNNLLNKYFLSYMKPYKAQFDFESEGEYYDYLRDANIRTLRNEIVKSYEEMEIANYLYINKINYEYEKKYKHRTADRRYTQYKPDFYLPDYGIYIEHFGIDKDGNVPEFFKPQDGCSAKETYNEGIRWKRELHKEKGTELVETYSWEKAEGVLTDNLEMKLKDLGVTFNAMSRNELWDIIEKDKAYELTSFVNLMNTFITSLKSEGYNIENIREKNSKVRSGYERMRNETFIKLVEPLFLGYEEILRKSEEIDFSDMINKAAAYVQGGSFRKIYKYIIVDEYQDISLPRFNLIKAIKEQNNAKLFCVGDDWQSIYRFAGSNIDLFTNFEKHFGYTEKSYIETTYRFNQNLIGLSSKFILKNKSQIKKQLKAFNTNSEQAFEVVYGEDHTQLPTLLKEKLYSLPENASVILLGRYRHDLQNYLDKTLTFKYNHQLSKGIVNLKDRKYLNIEFLTVHKSKGLQGDYVFIINTQNGKYGFPSNIEDDPVLTLLTDNSDTYEHAEERRLFYVALTRAKKFVYLMVDKRQKSPFIREMEKDNNIIQSDLQEKIPCPKCKTGNLALRDGIFYQGKKLPDFYGCSNYPYCSFQKKQEQ